VKKNVKCGDVLAMDRSLGSLNELTVPARVGIKVTRLVQKLAPELRTVADKYNDLVKKYGVDNGAGSSEVGPESPKWAEFEKERAELFETEIEVDVEPVVLPGDADVQVSVLAIMDGFVSVEE